VLLFPDNTVLINFALMKREDLLSELVSGRSAWTATVSQECARSAEVEGLEGLRKMPALFGTPLRLETVKEIVDATTFRTRMAAPGDPASRHLGEAEALAIISNQLDGSVFVTDDSDARIVAEAAGVQTYSTCHLLRLAVKTRRLTAQVAWSHVSSLRRDRRRLLDSPREQATYFAWCAAS
jgi:predicted nucleic acid-binding protein